MKAKEIGKNALESNLYLRKRNAHLLNEQCAAHVQIERLNEQHLKEMDKVRKQRNKAYKNVKRYRDERDSARAENERLSRLV